jgi:hypothetical protein
LRKSPKAAVYETSRNPGPARIRSWLLNLGVLEADVDIALPEAARPDFQQIQQQKLDDLLGEQSAQAWHASAVAEREAALKEILCMTLICPPQGSAQWTADHCQPLRTSLDKIIALRCPKAEQEPYVRSREEDDAEWQ